jgi:transcriptional regulator with XRE-family HTH domain
MTLGKRISTAIAESGLPIAKIAADADMSETTLRRLMKRDSADTSDLIKLSRLLGKPLSYFLVELTQNESFVNSNLLDKDNFNAYEEMREQKTGGYQMDTELLATLRQAEERKCAERINELKHQLELFKVQKASLEKELQLKDEIIELLKKNFT